MGRKKGTRQGNITNLEPSVSTPTFSHLLELPAELRNRIWELAATGDEETIDINESTKPPTWLSACRQIRKEALPLWMTSNAFDICVRSDTQIKQVVAFEQFCAEHIHTEKMRVRITFPEDLQLVDRPSQDALDLWAQRVHREGHWLPLRKDNTNIFAVMLITMLEVADRCNSLGWPETEDMIGLAFWGISEASNHFVNIRRP